MSRHVSLGVIGHVDHGKTSLVKAISGIDTDRLREEKERGMSIVLGFAHLGFEEGMIDLIDVPGHENFVRTMVSGATGIDAALLVVDVNEGVKPQTVEHLAIIELLGIRRGLVALTKCDLASGEARTAALHRLRKLLKGGCLAYAPMVFTSVVTGEGLDALRQAMAGLFAAQSAPPAATGRFYLPVDRAFSIAGRGTVVTGTLRLGSLKAGDEFELMPAGMRGTVRQLEFHNRAVEEATAGQRVGVNLRHIKPHEVTRGDALASAGLLHPASRMDVQVRVLASQEKPLRDGQAVRLLYGTTEVGARIRILSGAAVEPGQAGIAQLRTARPVAAVAGEAFILRNETPAATIGGGRFLDAAAARHRRSDAAAVMARLAVLARGSGDEVLTEHLKAAGYGGIGVDSLAAALACPEQQVRTAVAVSGAVMLNDHLVLHRPLFDALCDMLGAALDKFHLEHPTRHGAPLSHCRASLPRSVSEPTFKLVLRTLSEAKRIEVQGGLVRRFGYDPLLALSEAERRLASSIEASFRQGGVTPPDMVEVVEGDTRRRDLFYLLVERGSLLLLPGEQAGRSIVFHRDVISDIRRRMHEAWPPPSQFTVSDLRALLGSTRKFTVPLLEYFDAAGHTRRRGDRRMVVGKES